MDQNPPRVARLGQKWPPKNTFGQISLINHAAFKQSGTKRDHLPFKFFSFCKSFAHNSLCHVWNNRSKIATTCVLFKELCQTHAVLDL
jgi:hypothetical protein